MSYGHKTCLEDIEKIMFTWPETAFPNQEKLGSWVAHSLASQQLLSFVIRLSLARLSLARSLARSVGRLLDRSLARSIARSIARSLTDMCSLQSQYKGNHKGGRAAEGRAAPFVVAAEGRHLCIGFEEHMSVSERAIERASDRASE